MQIYIPSIKIGQKIEIFQIFKFKMADGRHIENRFWHYLGAILADQREIWNRNEGSHVDI